MNPAAAPAFTKWLNNRLSLRNLPPIHQLARDLASGTVLIQLLEIIGDTPLGFYNRNPRMRIQKVENINKALDFVRYRGVPLTNIGAEDIADQNVKLVLGLIWTLILRFTIAEINEEGLTAKEGLLLWCQRQTAPYPEVNIQDFTYSWQDGLAFCALIHRHRPDLFNFYDLDLTDRHRNTAFAFEVAEKYLDIPKLLDVEDVCDVAKPDEKSVMTYVAQYFHAFANLDRVDRAGRRVGKFAEVMQSVWEMGTDYERRVAQLMGQIRALRESWENDAPTQMTAYADARSQSNAFNEYKSTTKRTWVSEKHEVETLLGNIVTKSRTYNLAPYQPPAGLQLSDLEALWRALGDAEINRRKAINQQLRSIKDRLMKEYATLADRFEARTREQAAEIAALAGDLDGQLTAVNRIAAQVRPLEHQFGVLQAAHHRCQEANLEENDYTVFTVEDLAFDLSLLKQALNKKLAFIENQMVARNVSDLNPGQLEEFESTFRHFDRDQSNTLSDVEFKASLESLGHYYTDDEFRTLFTKAAGPNDYVTFEQFINFLVNVIQDQTTPEQVRHSFQVVAGDKPYVTEMDLKMSQLPPPVMAYLITHMPARDGATGEYDFQAYLDAVFQ
ncbi:alpha-actinin [Tieghemiomyces parasiticus]|uniref:Alpha-actinin n=1 Tax=Tieghemiomyces parasiticus TaxID=78921 RepID=A0A9W7ZS04_9FUNG|nr:alpha-actinin [Tieghemiomyces parasiticus]